jgi:PST family polysaccharide transporter
VVFGAREWFSTLVFGSPEHTDLVVLIALGLVVVAGYNFSIELFTALRNVRTVSLLQMFHSVAFATLGILLLATWENSAMGVLLAYGGSCLVALGVAAWWLRGTWRASPRVEQPVAGRTLWAKMMPFAGWVLLGSFLANLFQIADRYMILHHSGLPVAEALAQVGAYHSSRVVPLLLVSIAVMLGTMITPHLSHDWEAGRRRQVGEQLRLFVKLVGFGLSVAAVGVLVIAPLLFGVAFQGKFDDGLAILPWTLCYCLWFGMFMVLENYLWCAEKARMAGLALGVGLAVNVGLNLLLLPTLGLLGAVLATTVANAVVLGMICWFNYRLGFSLDAGLRVTLVLPLAVCLGPALAAVVLLAVAFEAARGERLLSPDEKRHLVDGFLKYSERLARVPWLGAKLARMAPRSNTIPES